jgi:hypothetical protein
MQLDQVFNMYNHVKKFGVDRSFLSLYDSNNQLSNMLGVKFPSCESVDCTGYPTSSYSQIFIVAMEDEKEGIFAKIGKGIKWIWEKIKELCTKVWDKIMSWFGSGDTTRRLEKCQQELKELAGQKSFGSRVKDTAKAVGSGLVTTAKVVTAPIRGVFRFCRKHWILTCLGLMVAIPVGIITLLGVIVYKVLKGIGKAMLGPNESKPSTPSMEDYPAGESGAEVEVEKSINEVTTNINGLDAKLDDACEIEQVDATVSNVFGIISDTLAIEKSINGTREKLNNGIKKITDFVNKATSGNSIAGMLVQKAASVTQTGIQKLIQSLFKSESTVRKVCGSIEQAVAALKQ